MNDIMAFGTKNAKSVATFGDHVHVYLSLTDWSILSNGGSVTMPLAKHPSLSKMTVLLSKQSESSRGSVVFENESLTLELPANALAGREKEVNVEAGGHRNYVIRLEGWKNDAADWSCLVENIRKKYLSTLQ